MSFTYISRIAHLKKELMNDFFFQMKKVILRINYKLYGLIFFPSTFKRHQKLKNDIILIYTLGKSGSSSVYYTLMKFFPFKKIFHVHFLSKHWLYDIFPNTPHERNIHKAEKVFNYLDKNKNKNIKLITLVREPISRDISGFFQNYRLMNIKIDKENIESIRKNIVKKGHDLAVNWFDTDFRNYTDFDIYDQSFNKNKGYDIYKINDKMDLLIIRTDKLSNVFTLCMEEFLGLQIGPLFNFNISSKKKDSKIVNRLKQYYYEDVDDLNQIYNSKFIKHFFFEDEISEFYNKWQKKELLK